MKTNQTKEKNQIAVSTLNEHCTNTFVFVESRETEGKLSAFEISAFLSLLY